MSKIIWGEISDRKFETGLSNGVLYPYDTEEEAYGKGVAWNGLSSVSESPEGAEAQDIWADNMKYGTLRGPETFGGTIECFTYPDEFGECNGEKELIAGIKMAQQTRKMFGFVYTTNYGSAADPEASGKKIHIVYGATCSPSEKQFQTINDSPEMNTMSYEFKTTPVAVTGAKPLSLLIVDCGKLEASKLEILENTLYGSDDSEPTLPLPDELKTLLS